MSGLQLSTRKDVGGQPGVAGGGAPPPIPSAGGPETRALGSHTQEQYSLPVPGAADHAPPPPPQPSGMVHRPPVVEEEETGGGRRLGVMVGVILVLSLLGTGGWYLVKHPGLFGKAAKVIPQRLDWPAIELSGMAGAKADGEVGSAILNGTLIAVNQRIEGVTLIEVTGDGVYLELSGERKFLRIGESTN